MFAQNLLAPLWDWLVGTFGPGMAEFIWIVLFIIGLYIAILLGFWILKGVARFIIKVAGVVGFIILAYLLWHMLNAITFFFATVPGVPII